MGWVAALSLEGKRVVLGLKQLKLSFLGGRYLLLPYLCVHTTLIF